MGNATQNLEALKLRYGARYPTNYEVEWLTDVKAQVIKDLTKLERFPAVKDFMKNVDASVSKITELEAKQERSKKTPPIFTAAIEGLMSETADWRGDVLAAVLIAYPVDQEVQGLFGRGVKVGASLGRMYTEVERLGKLLKDPQHKAVLDVVTTLDKDFVKRGEELVPKLKKADESQEGAMTDTPTASREVFAAKGEIYFQGRQVVRIARLALKRTERAGAYNYKILRRGEIAARAAKTREKNKEAK